jgi:uncharacterized protein (DUF2252 family)
MPNQRKAPPKPDDIRGHVDHLTPNERSDLGKEARKRTPRLSQSEFEPVASRPDPVDLLERQAKGRVQELVPIRYGRMLTSAFAFFRGGALIMASDLATTPSSGLATQLCGDAHLSNFGLFASPERTLMFDVNDFDETLPGPWEWDVKRLAASFVIAARDRGFTKKEGSKAAVAAGASYRTEMLRLAGLGNLAVWYARVNIEEILAQLKAQASSGSKADKQMASRTTKTFAKARTRDSMQALDKLTQRVDGQRTIISDPPLIVPVQELFPANESDKLTDNIHELLRTYRRSLQTDRRQLLESFEFQQLARKVVGVGSVGTRAWILLLIGRDSDDPLFLQAKEADASVLEEFVGKSEYSSHGERVVAGQHAMQSASDIFLGWQEATGVDGITRDYYLRQLRDWKGSYEIDSAIPSGLVKYGAVCGQALAQAHARSGDRIAIASYLGKSADFDQALGAFAETYADQNQRDYEALQDAVGTGRVKATTGV